MDSQKEAAEFVEKIDRAGYERGYKDGAQAALAAVAEVARAAEPAIKKRPAKRTPRGKESKSGKAKDVIKEIAQSGGKMKRSTVIAACEEKGIDKHSAGNALNALRRDGTIRMLDPGVYQAVSNGVAAEV